MEREPEGDRIRSWADLCQFVQADRRGESWRSYLTKPTRRYTLALRLTEWIISTGLPRPVKTAARMACRRYGRSFGFTIPPGVTEPGLRLQHWGTVVVSPLARIGRNCTIHVGVNIGKHHGEAPTIGDDCFIGPGAKLYGPITLGDGCRVGANAVVNQSHPAGSVIISPDAVRVR